MLGSSSRETLDSEGNPSDPATPGEVNSQLSTQVGSSKSTEPSCEAIEQLAKVLASRLAPALAKHLDTDLRRALAEDAHKRAEEFCMLRKDIRKFAANACVQGAEGTISEESSTSSSDLDTKDREDNENGETRHAGTVRKSGAFSQHCAKTPTAEGTRSGGGPEAAIRGQTDKGAGVMAVILEVGDDESVKGDTSAAPACQPGISLASSSRPTQSLKLGARAAVSTCPALPELGSPTQPSRERDSSGLFGPRRVGLERGGNGASGWARASGHLVSRGQRNDLLSVEQRLTSELFKARELFVNANHSSPGKTKSEEALGPVAGTRHPQQHTQKATKVLPAPSDSNKPTKIQTMLQHPELPQAGLKEKLPESAPESAQSPAAASQGSTASEAQLSQAVPHPAHQNPTMPPQPSSRDFVQQSGHSQLRRQNSAPKVTFSEKAYASSAASSASSSSSRDRERYCPTGSKRAHDAASEDSALKRSSRSVPSLSQQRDQEVVKAIDKGKADNRITDQDQTSALMMEGLTCSVRVALWKAAFSVVTGVPYICGVVPWRSRFRWGPWAYQAFMLTLALLSLCWLVTSMLATLASEPGTLPRGDRCVDIAVALGGLVPLFAFGGMWQNQAVATDFSLLTEYARREGFLIQCRELTCLDFVGTVALWALTLCTRAWVRLGEQTSALDLTAFAISTVLTAGMTTQIMSECRFLTKIVDTFCFNVAELPEFDIAMQEWSLIQALCRASCGNIEWPFLSLQVSGVLTCLSVLLELRNGLTRVVSLIPGILVCVSILRMNFRAAAVTDKCSRVPMLVNAISVEGEAVKDRMFVVDYIVHSRVGFYLFEVCLTSATILKALYVSGAIAFGLASRW